MKIPRSVMVKGEKYRVKFVTNLKNDNNEVCYGICDKENRIIYMEKGLSKDLEALTFMHECFHAACYESHLPINDEYEEQVVECLSAFVMKAFDVNTKSIRRK